MKTIYIVKNIEGDIIRAYESEIDANNYVDELNDKYTSGYSFVDECILWTS